MNSYIKLIVILCGVIIALFFVEKQSKTTKLYHPHTTPPSTQPTNISPALVKNNKPVRKGNVTSFMRHMGKIEGLGSYTTISKNGKYLGLYQFHINTLRSIGFDVTPDEFLNDPQLQDSAMVVYMKTNSKELKRIISRFDGKHHNGVFVTKAGILAGAHLVGTGGILSFFYPEKYQYRTVDGNGVHVSTYMTKFAGYNLRGI